MYERVVVRTNDYSVANEIKSALKAAGIRAFLRGSKNSGASWQVRCYKTRHKDALSVAQEACAELARNMSDTFRVERRDRHIIVMNTRKELREKYFEAVEELSRLLTGWTGKIPINKCPAASPGHREVLPRSALCPVVAAVGADDIKRQIVCEWIGCSTRVKEEDEQSG